MTINRLAQSSLFGLPLQCQFLVPNMSDQYDTTLTIGCFNTTKTNFSKDETRGKQGRNGALIMSHHQLPITIFSVKSISAENTSIQRRTDFASQRHSVPPTQNLAAMTLNTNLASNTDAHSPAWNEVSEPEAAFLILLVDTGR
jgi:hypothetical protein